MSHKNVFFGAGNPFHSHSCAKLSQADSFMARSTCSFEWLSTCAVRRDLADTGDMAIIHQYHQWMDKHMFLIFFLVLIDSRILYQAFWSFWRPGCHHLPWPAGFENSLVPLIFHQISDTLRSKPQSQRPRGRWDTLPTSNHHDINDKDSSRKHINKVTNIKIHMTFSMTDINMNDD